MKLMDVFRIAEGNLSILGVMLGDNLDEKRKKLINDGLTYEKWEATKGTIIRDPKTGIYTRYIKDAAIVLEGVLINRIFIKTVFSSFPNEVADSFLGIALEMEKYGVSVIKPKWQVFDDSIVNQYKTHNSLWDVDVNVKIKEDGMTIITLELSANLKDDNGEIAKDAVGVYKSIGEMVRRNYFLERAIHNRDKNIIFF